MYISAPSIERHLRDQGISGVVSVGLYPMLASTDTAHVVKPYTKAKGKYVAMRQQPRSTLRAHGRTRRFKADGGDGDGDGDLEGAIAFFHTPSRVLFGVTQYFVDSAFSQSNVLLAVVVRLNCFEAGLTNELRRPWSAVVVIVKNMILS